MKREGVRGLGLLKLAGLSVLVGSFMVHAPASGDVANVQLKRISGVSPFDAGCSDPGAYIDSEVEPSLAVDPMDPDHLVAAWQQDRYPSGGGARSNLVAVSRDGGETWTQRQLPGISRCTDPDATYRRVTDPWATIDAGGSAYVSSLAIIAGDNPSAGAEYLSGSADGGSTWGGPVAVEERNDVYLEKEIVTADPRQPGQLYMAWESDLVDPVLNLIVEGHMRFARSTDGGESWTTPITVPPICPVCASSPPPWLLYHAPMEGPHS